MFRSKSGNDAVPDLKSEIKEERALAKWVKVQVQSDLAIKKGEPPEVSPSLIDILRHQVVGFPFKYSAFLIELKEYLRKNGHTHVPCRHPTSLGS